ncbi:MAG: filamentous hemagglutinin N-terminal domain-containing protein, partial [Phenylobacterium sp.]|uniref:two-partner secretion domain-containing protein n=1 Tax=Phenylobacterium sp. TaxID=1871053 RepID=UPI002734E7B4
MRVSHFHTADARGRRSIERRAWLKATSAIAGTLALGFASNANALPEQGVVVAGAATIGGTAKGLTVNQSTSNAAINWQSFSIGAGETVQFAQPDSRSVTLNRVLGSDASTIMGRLSGNGQVFVVNPNGVLFGAGSQVNVGGLVASTLQITDTDFMAGRYRFSGAGAGAIVNRGSISADGGSVALLGAQVSNHGVISARLGSVSLVAGNAMTLDVVGDGLLQVTVDQDALNALAENGGLIRADGGQVVMSARSADRLLKTAVNSSGVIEAVGVESRGGVVSLVGAAADPHDSTGATAQHAEPKHAPDEPQHPPVHEEPAHPPAHEHPPVHEEPAHPPAHEHPPVHEEPAHPPEHEHPPVHEEPAHPPAHEHP